MNAAGWRARLPRDPDLAPPVLLLLGVVGLIGSTRHVLALAETHGADGPGAWLVAGVWEVMAAFSGWEIPRRHGWPRLVPAATLVAAVLFVLAANLEASGSPVLPEAAWRRIIAASPVLVFLSVLALVETRTWRRPRTARRVVSPRPGKVPVLGVGGEGTPADPGTTPGPDVDVAGLTVPPGLAGRVDALTPDSRAVWDVLATHPGKVHGIRDIGAALGWDRHKTRRALLPLLAADLVTSPHGSGQYAARAWIRPVGEATG